ncbi:MAG TPA: HD domain-containing protein [Ktedonobacterales bacterium]|nr:HD domain-containing protein [Ktedonobacterales bacterium]
MAPRYPLDTEASRTGASSGSLSGAPRPVTLPDPLYGELRLSAWAAALVATPPFRRLAAVSLSDVPGELLFDRPFPSRLDHTLGVYHLARVARPRDRALQAAALFHDLGHGPFSHLTEPLMRESLGMDHEERSITLIATVRSCLSSTVARRLAWLDWDEVAALLRGKDALDRGGLLAGRLDYDNADNLARFLLASGLGTPGYHPETLARALRPFATEHATEHVEDCPETTRRHAAQHGAARPMLASSQVNPAHHRAYVLASAENEARAWQVDRATVYRYLHEGHRNLAAHAMLRKAVDLAAATNILPPEFFDYTDAQALTLFARALDRGLVALVERVQAGPDALHRCVWEAEAPASVAAIPERFARWRDRLALEARLAAEAALAPHEVIVEALVSSGPRALPPIAPATHPRELLWQPEPDPSPRVLHVFVAAGVARDYQRRVRIAAERLFRPLGAVSREEETQS